MQIVDLFYLLDKKILIMDVNGALCEASKRQLALAGASIVGPLSKRDDVLLALPLHDPDAVIIDMLAEASDMVEIVRTLDDLGTPFLFATISDRADASNKDGFNLDGDINALRKITQALFSGSVSLRFH